MRFLSSRQRRHAAILLALLALGQTSRGAEIVPYDVTIGASGDAAVDDLVKQTSSLLDLREKSRVGPFALVLRAREDVGRMQAALNAQGYYGGRVTITIAGRRLSSRVG